MSYAHILCPVLVKKLCDVCQVPARQFKEVAWVRKRDGLPCLCTLLKDQK